MKKSATSKRLLLHAIFCPSAQIKDMYILESGETSKHLSRLIKISMNLFH